jgi:hypothetical protein
MLVPVREATALPEVKIGMKVTDVFAYSVFANSTSVDVGTNWSVLEAIVVTTPFSVRKIELPLIE